MTLVNKLDARMAHMDELVRRYFGGCNQADSARIAGCLVRDATHYFPPGMYDGPFRGAAAIGARWQSMVEAIGSYWTIDTLLIQPATWRAWNGLTSRRQTEPCCAASRCTSSMS